MSQLIAMNFFALCYHNLKRLVQHRKIKFTVETVLPVVFAVRTMLKLVINNMISNAIEFTMHKEITYITIGAAKTKSEYVFYVKDNGVGFDMKHAEKLFGLYQRLHTNDEFEGSGIGLITIKKIIEKHGGRTWIEAEVNKGATKKK